MPSKTTILSPTLIPACSAAPPGLTIPTTGAGIDVALVDTGVAPVPGLDHPSLVVNGPDLSLDLQAGNMASGTPVQVWSCGALGGAYQRWTRTRAGQIRYGSTNMCARVGVTSSR